MSIPRLVRPRSDAATDTYRGVPFTRTPVPVGDQVVIVTRFEPEEPRVDAPTFVLVHGIGVSSRYFRPLSLALRRFGAVVAVDLPGYGRSPGTRRPMSIADHAAALGDALEAQGIHPDVLVGHSMGAQVVSRLVVDRPAVTDRLVLLSPTVDPRHRRLTVQAARLLLDTTREGIRANAVVVTDYLFRAGVIYYLRQTRAFIEDRIEERLPQIEIPTLVVRGASDPVVRREWAEQMARLLPRGSFAEVPGPHVIMYTAPQELAELVAAHGG